MLQLMQLHGRRPVLVGALVALIVMATLAVMVLRHWSDLAHTEVAGMADTPARELLERHRRQLTSVVSEVRLNHGLQHSAFMRLRDIGFLDVSYDRSTERLTIEYARFESLAGRRSKYLEWLTLDDGLRRASRDRDGGECKRLDDHWWERIE